MFRSCLRSLTRFVTAVLLLGLMLCAVEVGLRALRVKERLDRPGRMLTPAYLTAPDAVCYLDVKRQQDISYPIADGETVQVRTNEFGLRGPTVVVPKPRGVYRILCLGGESLFAAGIPEDLTIPGQLRQLLSGRSQLRIEVLNGGCPGAGPLVHVLRLRHHLLSIQPDLVVLCLDPHDLLQDQQVRGVLRLDESDAPAFAVHPRFSSHGNDLLDRMCEEFITVEQGMDLTADLLGWKSGRTAPSSITTSRGDLTVIVDMQHLVAAGYGSLAVSLAPNAWGADPRRESQNSDHLDRDLRALLQEAGLHDRIPVSNALPTFRHFAEARRLFSQQTGMLTAEGNRLYAEILARWIVETTPGAWTPVSPHLGGIGAEPGFPSPPR